MAQPQQCAAQGLPEPEAVSLCSAVAHGHLAESVLPEHESTLFMGVQLCQLTKHCPTGDAVLDKVACAIFSLYLGYKVSVKFV